ncbi:bifunctional 2-C-methyl-D-erythritol 4-phosphate cytidylyltransferase/2-C-methyl-D-erythritol 2,4-cyclodiphosphate synthase [Paracoccus sp. p3-h83]|uniref:bifunctional 2-C-methyl-D-erythritol 4-phosphate cytidylyltransferase/2-C-methyl-D-erythritol 2,4-cyclodiphosphate synthase n=1 Tax=Paracoccus sp. p3-h83 TaxID=3342805 RepID=UPI0035B74DD7
MSVAIIITAAGQGSRMGDGPAKQWRDLAGVPVIARTIAAFAGRGRIVVTVPPDQMALAAELTRGAVTLIAGGATRAASIRNALEALEGTGVSRVLIHDGARPLVDGAVIDAVLAALDHAPAAAPALPVTDALWRGDQGRVTGLVDRTGLWRAQTPQGFHFDAILAAHRAGDGSAPDDVALAVAAGLPVAITAGSEDNLKLTFPGDFDRANRILGTAMDIRTGNGFDVHAFEAGDHVVLCGVTIPFDRGLKGHSDADVGMHALTDAIYGALADGDIGQHFPPSDPQWKGAASDIFLRHAAGLARTRGFRISHCDVTLICEAPKIGPHAGAMRSALAAIIGIEVDRMSVKATTTERLGFPGRGEGIAALATATLVKP